MTFESPISLTGLALLPGKSAVPGAGEPPVEPPGAEKAQQCFGPAELPAQLPPGSDLARLWPFVKAVSEDVCQLLEGVAVVSVLCLPEDALGNRCEGVVVTFVPTDASSTLQPQ